MAVDDISMPSHGVEGEYVFSLQSYWQLYHDWSWLLCRINDISDASSKVQDNVWKMNNAQLSVLLLHVFGNVVLVDD